MNYLLLPLLLPALMLAGCTLAPRYQQPAAPIASVYPDGPAYRPAPPADGAAAADSGWRDVFADVYLQQLIDTALLNNRDLRIAVLNIDAARAQYRIRRAELLPAIDGFGNQSAQGIPPALAPDGTRTVSREYSAGVGITAFELDLFGRVRSLKDQALEQYLAVAETRRGAQISLIAAVAEAYLNLQGDRELLQLTRATLHSQRQSYELSKRRFDQGVASELDMRQAQTAVETARSNLQRYTRLVAQDRNALTLLIGAALPPDLPATALDTQAVLAPEPPGLPAELLQRRPDIVAAEHRLKAANANIGAARAAFFPRFSLTASTGSASPSLNGLFDADTSAWLFQPQLSLPIFQGGANIANLDLAHVQKNLSIADYEKTIQTAFREVADALAARGTLERQLAAQRRLVAASDASYRLADLRYRNGVDSYLNTLVSQRSLYTAQQDLIAVRLAQLQSGIDLYKVLGGGWIERRGETARPADAAVTWQY